MEQDAATPDELLGHAEWLRSLALRLARDEAAAEDLVQDTWAAALRRPPRAGNLKPWLAFVLGRFARRSRRSELRRRQREFVAARERKERVEGLECPGFTGRSDAEVHEAFGAQRELAELVGALPEPYRTMVMRRYYDGWTAVEIARRTGVPAGTVRSQLARARNLLREGWNNRHGESSLRGLAGFALIADIFPGSIQQGAIVKSAHSAVVAAACLLVAASFWGGFALYDSNTQEALPVGSPSPGLVESEEDATDGAPALADVESVAGRESVLLDEDVPAASESVGEVSAQSRLLARILDSEGQPLPGARLDAAKRVGLGRAESDAEGRIVLVADRASIYIWNGQPQPMAFRVTAEGHATRFLHVGMKLDEDTDLGDVELQPGGNVVGRVVDETGAALSGVQVRAGEAALGRSALEAKLIGPVSGRDEYAKSVTGADGSYRLLGVAAGPGRVWATAPGHAWEFSSAFDVQASADTPAPELVLRSSEPEHSIAGVVLDPEGLPLAGAVVQATAVVAGEFRSSKVNADADGHFQVVVMGNVPHELEAFDSTAKYRPTYGGYVSPGTDDIELRLAQLQWVQVSVLDEQDGALLDEPWVMLRTKRYRGSSNGIPQPDEETLGPGLVRAPVPQDSFDVEASAPGYNSKSLGPFTAETVPDELELRLMRKPLVRGRVFADGQPVAGARVKLMRDVGEQAMLAQGFRTRLFDSGAAATTDDEGYFEEAVSSGWNSEPHVLHVSKQGWANHEQVVEVVEADVDGVEVVLTRGGSIEGQVLLRADRDPHGALVAASNGDSTVRTARANESGLYRFENLAPGPWEVTYREQEEQFIMGFASEPFEGAYEGDCVVVESATTRYDIDMRGSGGVIKGWLSIDGQPGLGWTARIERLKPFTLEQLGASIVLDSSGGFELTSDTQATRLVLETLETNEAFAMLSRELTEDTLPNECAVEFMTGRLTGKAAPGARLKFSVSLPAGWHYNAFLTVDATGQVATQLPAGEVKVSVARGASGGNTNWLVGALLQLRAGEEGTFAIAN